MGAQCKQTDDDSIIIAVMGCTGSGKSSFIKLLSGDDSIKTSNGLQSMTSEVQRFDFINSKSGRKVTIVDTPGFDDSEISDTEILRRITNFLLEEYDAKRKLNGLVYLHRVSDPRFGGQSRRNLRMFKDLCGTVTYKSVVILTTFWDRAGSQQEGEMRESELKSNFFRPLVQEGATFMQHDCTLDSARRVLDHIFTLVPVNVRVTAEIRVEGKTFDQTAAGSVRREEVDSLISQHKDEIAGFQVDIDASKSANYKLVEELAADKAEMQQKLAKWEQDMADLNRGLETEMNKCQSLQTRVYEQQQQWRVVQEQNNLIRKMQAEERTACQDLETMIEEEAELRINRMIDDRARIRELERQLRSR